MKLAYRKVHLKYSITTSTGDYVRTIYCDNEPAFVRFNEAWNLVVVHCPADIMPELDIPWDNVAALEESVKEES